MFKYKNIKLKLKKININKIKLNKSNLDKIDFNKLELNIINENPSIRRFKTKLNRTNLNKIKLNKIRYNRDSKAFLIYLLIFFISIGFASIARNLNITGSSLLKGQKFDVHFENVKVSDDGVQIEKPEIIDKTKVEYNIVLDKPGDFVEFTVDAKNDGTIDAMVSSIDEIKMYEGNSETPLESIPDYLDYSVTYLDYEDMPIAENHLLKAGKSITYKVHVEYKREIEEDQIVSSQTQLRTEFNVEFTQANKNAVKVKHQATESTLSTSKFKNFGEKNEPKEVIFVNTGVSDTDNSKCVDISTEQDNSILAWMQGDIMYVSAKETGLYVKAPEICTLLFGTYLDSWIKNLEVINLSSLDTSNVTSMYRMFYKSGEYAKTFEVKGLSGWDTSSVTDMDGMFYYAGYDATSFKIEGSSSWDTSNVTNMRFMFESAGYKATIFELNASGWDTSSVKDMSNIFVSAGFSATEWSIGDISGWDTSSVIWMNGMFDRAGVHSTNWSIGDISNWDTSKVQFMGAMFRAAGWNATTWSIGDISNWDTSNVVDMNEMFNNAGLAASYFLDLSGWNVDKVTYYSDFNTKVESKVTPPNWVN